MVRTLPWLKGSSASTNITTVQPSLPTEPSKRPRLLSPSPSASPHPRSPTKRLQQARSPSTSPPPEPPTAEPMRPGLSADDIYIMVEDEFLSVARTFTAHLHHAEYVRLKNEARDRNASTIKDISRPVDGRTEMRTETRKKIEAEARGERIKQGIEDLASGARRQLKRTEDGASSGSDFDPNEGQEAPWQGTQLQGFMVKSPRKGMTGLMGLQGVRANTRAAAGFERAVTERRARIGGSPTPRSKTGAAVGLARGGLAEKISDPETSSDDDDDLDAPSRAPSRPPPSSTSKPTPPPTNRHTKPIDSSIRPSQKAKPKSKPTPPPARRSFLDLTPLPKPPETTNSTTKTTTSSPSPIQPTHPLNTTNDSPTSISSIYPPSSSREEILARRRRLKARKEQQERQKEREREAKGLGGGGMRVEEVPIFLV